MQESSQMEIPKFTPVTNSGNEKICPKCKGTGIELYQPDAREFTHIYGDTGIEPQPFARKCRQCNGYVKDTVDLTEVPFEYVDADITKFDFDVYSVDMSGFKKVVDDFVNNFKTWQSRGKGFYFCSKTPGTGKSFLSACIGKSVMMKNGLRFKFITAPDYIEKCSEAISIRKSGGFYDPSKIYQECELLVLDDIGAQVGKEWQQQELFVLINERSKNCRPTIYTSNLPIESLNLDERSKSRIFNTTIQLQLPEESIREKKAKAEQNNFLKGIFEKC